MMKTSEQLRAKIGVYKLKKAIIAERAGVCRHTVTKVVNQGYQSGVKVDLYQKVCDAVDALATEAEAAAAPAQEAWK